MTTAYDPPDAESYAAKSGENQSITGFGFENVRISSPCPFCASPGFVEYLLIEVSAMFGQELRCGYCERAGIFSTTTVTVPSERGGVHSTTVVEFLQTAGDPPPSYLPKINRTASPAPAPEGLDDTEAGS